MAGLSHLKHFRVDSIYGGRPQRLICCLTSFFERLQKAGAKFAFFVESFVNPMPEQFWMKRHNHRFKVYQQIYQEIENGADSKSIVEKDFYHGFTHTPIYCCDFVQKLVQKFGPVFHSVKESRHVTIARYARDHKAYAVIGDGTDLIIFHGIKRVWLKNTISFENALTKDATISVDEMQSDTLCRALGLIPGLELALWATLCGNPFLGFQKYARHFRFRENRLKVISEYIINLRGSNLWELIPGITFSIVKKAKLPKHQQAVIRELIESSLEFYLLRRSEMDQFQQEMIKKFEKEDTFLHYVILANKTFCIPLVMENERYKILKFFYISGIFNVFNFQGIFTCFIRDNCS